MSLDRESFCRRCFLFCLRALPLETQVAEAAVDEEESLTTGSVFTELKVSLGTCLSSVSFLAATPVVGVGVTASVEGDCRWAWL